MKPEQKKRVFELCIKQIQEGRQPDEVLAVYPGLGSELRPALQAARAAYHHGLALPAPGPGQVHSRADFLRAAQQLIPRPRRSWLALGVRLILILLVAAAILLPSAWVAIRLSERALPGDLLYPVKTAAGQMRLFFAGDPRQRLQIELALDQERLEEAKTLIQEKRSVEVEISAGLQQAADGKWLLGNIPLDIPANARVVGQVLPGYDVRVQGLLQSDGSLQASLLQRREYEILGAVESQSGESLVISGIAILMTPQTILQGAPTPGKTIRIIAVRTIDGVLQARLVEVLADR
ncbi:MAG: hypothetical protein JXB15_16910 [Anaerolineales bacterium]|nr:hypothetical protein [Anaerolineales bacterium]